MRWRLGRGGRKPTPPKDGTLDTDFGWLSSVFNWARRRKLDGRRILAENPLHELDRPKGRQPRRPVARHERFVETMKRVDEMDPMGRLRCILSLARYTGHRESGICHFRASDLLLSEMCIRTAWRGMGWTRRLRNTCPHGAIRWRSKEEKQGLLLISPISRQAREAVDRYLRENPRTGEVPLFPAPGAPRKKGKPASAGPEKAISRHLAAKRLIRAEGLAGLVKLDRGTFHRYRRLWASERKRLPDVDVAQATGWKDTRAMKSSYQQADPATVLKVVEFGS